MKKIWYFLPLFIWTFLTLLDSYYFFTREKSPIYWRAWEYASNYTGKDAAFAPFKPWSYYSKPAVGDLLNVIQFEPKPEDYRKHEFIVDEYGYRNRPGFLDKPVNAVIIGSSFIAGGAETQDHLISEILTRDYGIRTYNYSTSLQYFWDDFRFLENPPQYVFLVGTEGEIIQSLWKFTAEEKKPYNKPQKWASYLDWKKNNETTPPFYRALADELTNYSIVRYLSIRAYIKLLNTIYTREEIAKQTSQTYVSYDANSNTLFWQKNYDNPKLGVSGKTLTDIQTAVTAYKATKKILDKRKIQLIIVPVPSKHHLANPEYYNLPDESTAISKLNSELRLAGLWNIDIFKQVLELRKDRELYYSVDSHWNSEMNYFLAKMISDSVNSSTSTQNK